MKVAMENDLIILYLNKYYIKNIDFSNKEILQKYIKNLFIKLQKKYDLVFNGYYNLNLYVDKNYGVIIEIKQEELEYLDYFGPSLEVNTNVFEDSFLYEINDIDDFDKNFFMTYILKDHIYIKIKEEMPNIKMGMLLETVIKIIYGKQRKRITQKSKIVRWKLWINQ